jgi:leucyl aminopeptidase
MAAREEFKPQAMVELDLTGAIITSLGHERAGLFSTTLPVNRLRAAGAASAKLWRLPLGSSTTS